ncbi:hypothetical protein C2E31_08930 [Rhodopirellula baltica]|nr:hypothetical protein C2E31_08930 [Rhodopirellula baltica]
MREDGTKNRATPESHPLLSKYSFIEKRTKAKNWVCFWWASPNVWINIYRLIFLSAYAVMKPS